MNRKSLKREFGTFVTDRINTDSYLREDSLFERFNNPNKAHYYFSNCVYCLCLNHMEILPKYNSPSSDVVSSNAPPLHRDGSRPIGGFLLGNNNG